MACDLHNRRTSTIVWCKRVIDCFHLKVRHLLSFCSSTRWTGLHNKTFLIFNCSIFVSSDKMTDHGTMITSFLAAVIILASEVTAVRYVPKWKKQVNFPKIFWMKIFHRLFFFSSVFSFGQACEIPASQNEQSHYTCDDNGDLKCLPGACSNL